MNLNVHVFFHSTSSSSVMFCDIIMASLHTPDTVKACEVALDLIISSQLVYTFIVEYLLTKYNFTNNPHSQLRTYMNAHTLRAA